MSHRPEGCQHHYSPRGGGHGSGHGRENGAAEDDDRNADDLTRCCNFSFQRSPAAHDDAHVHYSPSFHPWARWGPWSRGGKTAVKKGHCRQRGCRSGPACLDAGGGGGDVAFWMAKKPGLPRRHRGSLPPVSRWLGSWADGTGTATAGVHLNEAWFLPQRWWGYQEGQQVAGGFWCGQGAARQVLRYRPRRRRWRRSSRGPLVVPRSRCHPAGDASRCCCCCGGWSASSCA